jgi:hypothetical protein
LLFDIIDFQCLDDNPEKNFKKRHENVFQAKKPHTFAAAFRAKFIEGDYKRGCMAGSRVIYSRFRAADFGGSGSWIKKTKKRQ